MSTADTNLPVPEEEPPSPDQEHRHRQQDSSRFQYLTQRWRIGVEPALVLTADSEYQDKASGQESVEVQRTWMLSLNGRSQQVWKLIIT